jgi:hypothetical protein
MSITVDRPANGTAAPAIAPPKSAGCRPLHARGWSGDSARTARPLTSGRAGVDERTGGDRLPTQAAAGRLRSRDVRERAERAVVHPRQARQGRPGRHTATSDGLRAVGQGRPGRLARRSRTAAWPRTGRPGRVRSHERWVDLRCSLRMLRPPGRTVVLGKGREHATRCSLAVRGHLRYDCTAAGRPGVIWG